MQKIDPHLVPPPLVVIFTVSASTKQLAEFPRRTIDRDRVFEFIPLRPNRLRAAYKCFVHLRCPYEIQKSIISRYRLFAPHGPRKAFAANSVGVPVLRDWAGQNTSAISFLTSKQQLVQNTFFVVSGCALGSIN